MELVERCSRPARLGAAVGTTALGIPAVGATALGVPATGLGAQAAGAAALGVPATELGVPALLSRSRGSADDDILV